MGIDACSRRITELEALVQEQQRTIQELSEAVAASDVEELQAILEAQESALEEQRTVIASQSGLIDELNMALQAQLKAAELREAEDERQAEVKAAALHRAQESTRGSHRLGKGAPPLKGPNVHPALQKLALQQGHSQSSNPQSPRKEATPRPRPTSALGGRLGSGTPRARSCTETRLLAPTAVQTSPGTPGGDRAMSPRTGVAARVSIGSSTGALARRGPGAARRVEASATLH